MPVYDIDSSSGNVYKNAIVLSTADIEPLSVEPPIHHDKLDEHAEPNRSGMMKNNIRTGASNNTIDTKGTPFQVDAFDIPKFDFGISPGKTTKYAKDEHIRTK